MNRLSQQRNIRPSPVSSSPDDQPEKKGGAKDNRAISETPFAFSVQLRNALLDLPFKATSTPSFSYGRASGLGFWRLHLANSTYYAYCDSAITPSTPSLSSPSVSRAYEARFRAFSCLTTYWPLPCRLTALIALTRDPRPRYVCPMSQSLQTRPSIQKMVSCCSCSALWRGAWSAHWPRLCADARQLNSVRWTAG